MSDSELERFHREGYLVVDGVFSDADLQPVIDEAHAEVQRRAADAIARGELSRTYAELGFERQLTHISRETDKVVLSMWHGGLHGPALFDLIRHPALLDVAQQFCGEELVASSVYRFRPKIPNHVMGPVPWHQDSGYFEPYCDKSLVLTVWLPLVDATEENGCLYVIPGAHRRQEVLRHVRRREKPYLMIPSEELPGEPECQPVCVPVMKGSVLLLTNLTPHASYENRTEEVRWAIDLRYQSAALPTNARISRLPGEAVPSETVPGACYPPEADFLVRSRRRPGEVVTSPEEFARLRSSHVAGAVNRSWEVIEA